MIKTVIIENERPSKQILYAILKKVAPDISIIATLATVKESINYFSKAFAADLILCDVELSDGLSFEIFDEVEITIPVIFITGFEKFIVHAFQNNGIDYSIKPVTTEDISKAIQKYRNLQNYFGIQNTSFTSLLQYFRPKKKNRILIKKGIEYIPMKVEDIVLFYTENKIVYVFNCFGKKFLIDKTMNDLENELDRSIFFRVNRQYIVNLNFIKSFKTYEKVKLKLELNISEINHFIIISQKTAALFRSWIAQL